MYVWTKLLFKTKLLLTLGILYIPTYTTLHIHISYVFILIINMWVMYKTTHKTNTQGYSTLDAFCDARYNDFQRQAYFLLTASAKWNNFMQIIVRMLATDGRPHHIRERSYSSSTKQLNIASLGSFLTCAHIFRISASRNLHIKMRTCMYA